MIDLRSGSQVSQWGKLKYIIHSSIDFYIYVGVYDSSDLFKSFRTVVI